MTHAELIGLALLSGCAGGLLGSWFQSCAVEWWTGAEGETCAACERPWAPLCPACVRRQIQQAVTERNERR